MGIVNGTTNYILDRMDGEGADFADVLADAQRLGYAEADPTADVEGYDAAQKAAILASLAFHTAVPLEAVHREGITTVTADNAVELHGITKRFPGVVANSDLHLQVERGTIHAIVGENGAGKSTLMKILYGVQKPDEGTIRINGEEVSFSSPKDAIKAGVGMVFQHFMLADNLTVLENVVLGAEKLHGIGAKARTEIQQISDAYGLGVHPDTMVADLGVGAR